MRGNTKRQRVQRVILVAAEDEAVAFSRLVSLANH